MQNKICILCGKSFVPRVYNQLVCDNEHYVKCPICNKEYLLDRTNLKNYYRSGKFKGCSAECTKQITKLTKIERYGSENYYNTSKAKQTRLKRYGNKNYNNREKSKITLLNKYGDEHYRNISKTKQTKLERYGNENYNNMPKNKQTKLERYGDENYNNREKSLETRLSNNNGVYWTSEQIKHNINKKFEYYGKGNNGDKISKSLRNKSTEQKKRIRLQAARTMQHKYGVNAYSKKHILKSSLDILENKTNFIKYCEQHKTELNFVKCALDLKISPTCFASYFDKYELRSIYTLYQTSYLEKDIHRFLTELGISYLTNTRSVISPKELDIYIPEKNLAIECNGLYWHSSAHIPDSKYHYNKSKMCEEKGIRLIHIYEYEWNNERQRPILENIIKNALGINEHKIYARNCKIEVKESREMKEFFNRNNIQGFRGGKFAICLVDKKTREVYMAYMMGKAYFGKGKYEWEVIRGATKLGYTVIGGASKIFKYFIKTYNPQNCVYYIDYNYFNGNSLKNLPNMKYIKTQPSFKNYFRETGEVKNRDPMHHKEITEGYKKGTILQIWNAGTKVYVWNKEKI